MKKFLFISVLVADIVTGYAEQRCAYVPQEMNEPKSRIHGARETRIEDSRGGVLGWMKGAIGLGSDNLGDDGNKKAAQEDLTPLGRRPSQKPRSIPPPPSELRYLKELAKELSIPVSDLDTPSEIVFAIKTQINEAEKQRIKNSEQYGGETLSEESFEMVRSSIPIPSVEKVIIDYHNFIKKIAGKKLIVIEKTKEP